MESIDKDIYCNWLEKAKNLETIDPSSSFICTWISFNHYYSTFAQENKVSFKNWSRVHYGGKKGDKAELFYLVNHTIFNNFFSIFKKSNSGLFSKIVIELPIIDTMYNKNTPEGLTGRHKLSEINNDDIFSIIYQIRNNLFHGRKDPSKRERDITLCKEMSNFMIPFLSSLIEISYSKE